MNQLDIEEPAELLAYLRGRGVLAADELPQITVLAGGVSNKTVLVERPGGEPLVLKQALPKLRVAVDWFSDPARIQREAAGMRWLTLLAPPGSTTPLLFEDQTQHVLAMDAVPQPHSNWKSMLLAGDVRPEHVQQFGTLLGTIHRRAWEQRAAVEPVFADRHFFETLRLEPYYAYTAARVPPSAAFYGALIAETLAQPLTLVHGDYSPKNVLVQQDRLVLLDHEVIHWGDPAFDLGFALTHLLSKAHHLAAHRAAFAAAAVTFWTSYQAALDELPWAAELEPRVVRQTLGCLLARVAGRSPLEYLDPAERARQQRVCLELIAAPPDTVAALTDQFLAGCGGEASASAQG